jgi:hypothetical protein
MPFFWQIRGYFLLILSTNLLTVSWFQISGRPQLTISPFHYFTISLFRYFAISLSNLWKNKSRIGANAHLRNCAPVFSVYSINKVVCDYGVTSWYQVNTIC